AGGTWTSQTATTGTLNGNIQISNVQNVNGQAGAQDTFVLGTDGLVVKLEDGETFNVPLNRLSPNTLGSVKSAIQTVTNNKVTVNVTNGPLSLLDTTRGSGQFAISDIPGSHIGADLGMTAAGGSSTITSTLQLLAQPGTISELTPLASLQ